MPKATRLTTITAECGHSFVDYPAKTAWGNCPDCMTRMRLNMQMENAHRRYTLRVTRRDSTSYYIAPTVRLAVYERDEWTCQLCLDPVDPDLPSTDIWSATLDHIVCRSWVDEPDHSETNLRLAHRWCNSVRGDESYHDPSVLLPPAA